MAGLCFKSTDDARAAIRRTRDLSRAIAAAPDAVESIEDGAGG